MSRIQIFGAAVSSYVWVVRMVCEEKRRGENRRAVRTSAIAEWPIACLETFHIHNPQFKEKRL
jgi:hypothetical protein